MTPFSIFTTDENGAASVHTGMALITTNAGELLLLKWALQSTSTPENLVLHLFSNNYSPVSTSVVGSFTEATFTGYSAQTLSRASWGNPSTVSNAASSTYSATLTWTASSGQTIYGYYITGATSTTTVIWAERFSTPRILVNGDVIQLTPVFTLDSAN